jgi:phosphoribosylanthranilate isomerase
VTVEAKICGVSTAEAIAAAVSHGAAYLGFVFYPRSPRHVTPVQAATLAAPVPAGVVKVGLFVDPDDATLAATLAEAPLDLLQLHGAETPARVAEVRRRTGLPVMKAIKVAAADDLATAHGYEEVADRLLFDAKTPASVPDALPGGMGAAFDWHVLEGAAWRKPWMLSGGLTADNVAEAVRISGAPAVDVSSGVEDRPGHKDPSAIAAFLDAVAGL